MGWGHELTFSSLRIPSLTTVGSNIEIVSANNTAVCPQVSSSISHGSYTYNDASITPTPARYSNPGLHRRTVIGVAVSVVLFCAIRISTGVALFCRRRRRQRPDTGSGIGQEKSPPEETPQQNKYSGTQKGSLYELPIVKAYRVDHIGVDTPTQEKSTRANTFELRTGSPPCREKGPTPPRSDDMVSSFKQ